jgi:uncharacterized glyoxalase superfamily protein PhnB
MGTRSRDGLSGGEIDAWREAGVEVVREPEDQEWGERMASVLDPEGNDVYLGQRLEAS